MVVDVDVDVIEHLWVDTTVRTLFFMRYFDTNYREEIPSDTSHHCQHCHCPHNRTATVTSVIVTVVMVVIVVVVSINYAE